jgi:antitoxin (DNA-binding transcriptional repressor) of toxin-antitoxin stability system
MRAISKVGIREFRTHLPRYLTKLTPVAITRHGETIGFYIPTRSQNEKPDLEALKQAALKFEKLLLSHGITEEELFADFRSMSEEKNK